VKQQRGFVGILALIWLAGVIGWCLNIYQIFKLMPATMGEATPFWVAKCVCVFLAPVGSVLGYVGLFQ
jgi:hypothetical protein